MKKSLFIFDIAAILTGIGLSIHYTVWYIALYGNGYWSGMLHNSYVNDIYKKQFLSSAIFILAGILLIICGLTSIQRWRRYRFYLSIIGNRGVVTAQELSKETCYSLSCIRHDMRGMIRRKCFSFSHFDSRNGVLILDGEMNQQYQMELQKWQTQREKLLLAGVSFEEYQAFLTTSEQVTDIKEYSHLIADAEIKKRLTRISRLLGKLVKRTHAAPELLTQAGRLYSFYVPQLHKLTREFWQLEKLEMGIENAVSASGLKETLAQLEELLDLFIATE